MKKTIKFFAILAVLLFAASCQENNLDNGQGIDSGKLNLTATIVTPDASRVTYDVDNETTHTITPSWTVGDKIIGFDDEGVTFTFEVASLNGDHAVLDDGGYVPGSATKLYAIYAPGKLASDISANTLSVDLGTQSGELDEDSPVLMCATAAITGSDVTLDFENQTAIIGVTKFKLPAAGTLTSISVDGLVTAGTFEVSGDVLVLTPAATTATATATGSWATGAENVCETAIYFATLPTASAKIALRASDGVNDYGNLASIAATDIAAGNYYYMAKNLGAPVAEVAGVKYGTIDDAWAAANRANSAVTVTLLANCTTSNQLKIDGTGTGAVTFDMNGHDLNTTKQIRVIGRTLTILDSSSATLAEQGKITSTYTGGRGIYVEAGGTLYYQGCTITHNSSDYGTIYLRDAGTRGFLSGGKAISQNYRALSVIYGAEVELSGSVELWATGHTIYASESSVINITGGSFVRGGTSGYNVVRTGAADAVVNITGGVFDNTESTSSGTLIYAGADGGVINVEGGYFKTTGVNPVGSNGTTADDGIAYVTGGCFNKAIQPKYAKSSTDVIYTNVLNPDAGTSDTYPYTVSSVSVTPTVAVTTQSTNTWNHGTVESAFKCADQRAKGNGVATLTLQTDAAVSQTLTVNSGNSYNVVLDLNGHLVSSTVSPVISSSGKLVVNDLGSGGEISTTGAVVLSVSDGTAAINSGSLSGATNAVSVSGGTLNIYGGHIYGGGAADIVKTGGDIALSGGYYRYEPDGAWLADGYASSAATEVFKTRSYDYMVVASSVAATVAGENYGSWASAVAAACSYSGVVDTVRMVLQEDITDAGVSSLEHSTLPILLDLNGHILSSPDSAFLKCQYSLTIVDTGVSKGKITSSRPNVICKVGTGKIELQHCTIECTQASAVSYNAAAVVYMNNSGSTLVIDDCKIYSTGSVTAVSNRSGTLTISNSEVTSGTSAAGLVGIYNGGSSATTVVNNCSVVTTSTTDSRGVFYNGSGASACGTIEINGGYYYGNNFGRSYSTSDAGQFAKITVNSGYSNNEFKYAAKNYPVTIPAGKSQQECSVKHTHATTGVEYTYTYKVDTTPEP